MDEQKKEPSRQGTGSADRLMYRCPAFLAKSHWCELGDNPCFRKDDVKCEYYEEFLEDLAREE